MKNNKMTEAEIMKALECCANWKSCKECPLYSWEDCTGSLKEFALDLINRKNAECKDLQNQLSIFKKLLDKAEAEILRLEDAKNAYKDIVDTCEDGARAEAIKEFAERVKATNHECGCNYRKKPVYAVTVDKINQIAKEMGVEL